MGLIYISRHTKHWRLKKTLAALLPFVLVFLLAWLILEPKLLRVENVTLENSALDSSVGRLRIVYLTDIHYGNWPYLSQSDLNSLATRINEQKPDLVLLGGDYGNDPDSAAAFFRQLPAIRATYGTLAVLG